MKDFFEALSRFFDADQECRELKAPTWKQPLPLAVREALDKRTKAMADAELAFDAAIDRRVRHMMPLLEKAKADYLKSTGNAG